MNRHAGRRVAHLSSVHRALDHRIFYKECRALSAAGFEVTLIAPHDNDEQRDGIRILAVGRPRSRWERIARTIPEVFRRAREVRAEVYHLHDPELLPLGWLLRRLGARVVYDAHEDLPAQFRAKRWIHPWLRPIAGMAGRALVQASPWCAEQVVGATPGIARQYGDRGTAVCNFPEISGTGPCKPYRERPADAVYVGSLNRSRGLVEMVEAIEHVRPPQTRLLLAGPEQEPGLLSQLRTRPGWARVAYRGVLSVPRVACMFEEARVGLVVMHPEPNHRLHPYPVKLLEYLSAGLPVVASDFPVWREFLEPLRCARFVDPRDPAAVAREISWILSHPTEAEAMGRRGREAVLSQFNWNHEAEQLVRLYRRLAA